MYPRDYVPIYPGQQTVAELIPKLTCPVFGGFGELDPAVPLDHIQRFRSELEQHGTSYTIQIYAGAPHGWMNHTLPNRYRPEQSEAAWGDLLGFFRQVFAGEWPSDRAQWRFASDRAIDPAPSRGPLSARRDARQWRLRRRSAILAGGLAATPLRVAHSSSGQGHRPLKAKITGSNPVCATILASALANYM